VKKLHYNKITSQSSNKTKAVWNVIKAVTNKRSCRKEELMLNVEGKLIKNPQILADTFQNYFSKVMDESVLNITKQDHNQSNQNAYLEYLVHVSCQTHLTINLRPVTEK
jgi:hypothetical protein